MRRLLVLAAVASLGVLASACGTTTRTTTVRVMTVERVRVSVPAPRATTPPAQSPRRVTRRRAPSGVACDPNVTAKVGTTSCAFAENVFWSFWHAWENGDDGFMAYSPVTKRRYDVSCTSADVVSCRAADGAEIRFPLAAVRAYTSGQAQRYAATHETGPRTDATTSSACDPNYVGQCLNPSSSDYDCKGGSGDGPDYTGRVEVVGDDHYELDRDVDGVACDR